MNYANKEYKDRLFSFLYGSAGNEAWTLDLYNAVNGTAYDDPAAIEITTIREVLYMGMHNDVSFMIAGEMNMYEQQSTYCPNMPLRMLQYAGNLYEKYVKRNRLNKFGSSVLKLPVPKLIVFYNGTGNTEDEIILRLKDSFEEGPEPDIEVAVRMININYGRNEKLMKSCESLKEYSWLIDEIRKNLRNMELKSALDKAIDEMPEDFILKKFLLENRTEVSDMLLTEYNEAEAMELFREDGKREGRELGLEEGRKLGLEEGLEDGIATSVDKLMSKSQMTAEEALDFLEVPEEKRKAVMERVSLLD